MPTFPRTLRPAKSTLPTVPAPHLSVALTGSLQTRGRVMAGRMWTETWPLMKAGDPEVESLLATIEDYKHRGTIVDVDHILFPGSGKAPNGTGGGSPRVNGADEKGASINTDGWTANVTNIVRAGDCVRIAGHDILYRVTTNASSNSSGRAVLFLNPPVYTAPSNNATISTTNNRFKAIIVRCDVPEAAPNEYYGGLAITFQEAP